ncbi:MAG: DUF1565 domain-containing protein [Proteobacteria bacterium]|nr:DUF1565 domain-containing protein [Pseudomonadota bacterium]NBP13072.1 DUF1565 domain-containing protein [bacterium]
MPYRSFADFSEISPIASDYIVGFRPLQGEFKVNFYTLSKIITGGLTTTPNVLYVTTSGSDTNFRGIGEDEPFKTIKKACSFASFNPGRNYTIFVRSGNYVEQNPIYVPPNTTLIGDNLRRTNIYPANRYYDILWVSNATYVWGFTFRNHLAPSAAVAFPNIDTNQIPIDPYQIAFNYPGLSAQKPALKPFITTSPYIQGCSSITQSTTPGADDAGCGMRIDGKLVRGYLRSMVMDSYTQFNEGGIGINIINNGYAQLVSTFTIACTYGVLVSAGGGCDINTSNCSFGNYGLAAYGKSPYPILSGATTNQISPGQNQVIVNGVTPTALALTPGQNLICSFETDPSTFYVLASAGQLGSETFTLVIEEPTTFNSIIPAGSKVDFYIRSNILASAITFEYVGSGTTLSRSLPTLGGQTIRENEAVFDDNGVVFFTATNESGDFRVGSDFTIKQATGTIEGRTFQRSIFSLVTPFVLSIE